MRARWMRWAVGSWAAAMGCGPEAIRADDTTGDTPPSSSSTADPSDPSTSGLDGSVSTSTRGVADSTGTAGDSSTSTGVSTGSDADTGRREPVELTAQWLSSALDRVFFFKRNEIEGTCAVFVIASGGGADTDVVVSRSWGVEEFRVYLTPSPDDCAMPTLAGPPDQQHVATAMTGTIVFTELLLDYAPCVVDIDVTVTWDTTAAPWVPAQTDFVADGLVVQGVPGC